jgi:hypothetical protein
MYKIVNYTEKKFSVWCQGSFPKKKTKIVQFLRFVIITQNPFEVNLTIVGVKIGHDHKWDIYNPLQTCTSLR